MSKNVEIIKKIYEILNSKDGIIDIGKLEYIVSRLSISEKAELKEAISRVPDYDLQTGIKNISNIKEFKNELEKQGYYLDYDTTKNLFLTYIAGKRTEKGRPIPTNMFTGIPGSGKTSLAENFARVIGAKELYLQCVNGIDKDTFQKSANIEGIIRGDSKNAYQSGILCRALEQSHVQPVVVVIDEADKATPEIDAMFYDYVENGRVTTGADEYVKGDFPIYMFFTSNGDRKFDQTFLSRCKKNDIARIPKEKFLDVLNLSSDSYLGYIYDKVPEFTLRQAKMYIQDLEQLKVLNPDYRNRSVDEIFNSSLLSQYVDLERLDVNEIKDIKEAKLIEQFFEKPKFDSIRINIDLIKDIRGTKSNGIKCVNGKDQDSYLKIDNYEQLEWALARENMKLEDIYDYDDYFADNYNYEANRRIGEGGWIQIPFVETKEINWLEEDIAGIRFGLYEYESYDSDDYYYDYDENDDNAKHHIKFVTVQENGMQKMLAYVESIKDLDQIKVWVLEKYHEEEKEYVMQKKVDKIANNQDGKLTEVSEININKEQIEEMISLVKELEFDDEDVAKEVKSIIKDLRRNLSIEEIGYNNSMLPVTSIDDLNNRFRELNYYLDDDMLQKIAIYYNIGINYTGSGVEAIKLSGVAGGGKTSLAERFADVFQTQKYIIQCTDGMGIDNFQITPNLEGILDKDPNKAVKNGILLRAIEASRSGPVTLLIDEIDKTTPDVDAFLLDFIEKGRVSLGTKEYVKGEYPIYVMFTSNDKRTISDALISRSRNIEVPRLKKELFLERLGLPENHYLGQVYDEDSLFTLRQAIPYMEGLKDLKKYDPDYENIDLNTYVDSSLIQYLSDSTIDNMELENLSIVEEFERYEEEQDHSISIDFLLNGVDDLTEYSDSEYLSYWGYNSYTLKVTSLEEWESFKRMYSNFDIKEVKVTGSFGKILEEDNTVVIYSVDGVEETSDVYYVVNDENSNSIQYYKCRKKENGEYSVNVSKVPIGRVYNMLGIKNIEEVSEEREIF